MARMPEPAPTSSTCLPARSWAASQSRHSAVVGWVPVPNAKPGSRRTVAWPGAASAWHDASTIRSRPKRRSPKPRRQVSLQSSSAMKSMSQSRGSAERSAPRGSSASTRTAFHRSGSRCGGGSSAPKSFGSAGRSDTATAPASCRQSPTCSATAPGACARTCSQGISFAARPSTGCGTARCRTRWPGRPRAGLRRSLRRVRCAPCSSSSCSR